MAGSDGGELVWELREGPSEEVAFKRQKKEPAMGTWKAGKSPFGTGRSKGNGPDVGMSLECSRKSQEASVTAALE